MEVRRFRGGPPCLFLEKSKYAAQLVRNIQFRFSFSLENRKIKWFFIDDLTHFIIASAYNKADGVISIIDMRNFQTVTEFYFPKFHQTSFCLSPDMKWLFVVLENKSIRLYSFLTGELIHERKNIGDGYKCFASAFSPDSRYIVCGFENGDLFIFDVEKDLKNYVKKFSFKVDITSINFSLGGNLLIVGLIDGTAFVLSIFTDHIWRQKLTKGEMYGAGFSYTTPLSIYSYSDKNGEICTWNFKNNQFELQTKIKVRGKLRLVSYSYSVDKTVVFGCSQKQLFCWDSETGKLFQQLDLQELQIDLTNVSSHPMVRNLCLIESKSSISIWNYENSEYFEIYNVQIPDPLIHAVVWVDSFTIHALFADGSMKIFSTVAGNWSLREKYHYETFTNNDGKQWPYIIQNFYGKYYFPQFIKDMSVSEKKILEKLEILNVDTDPISSDDSSDEWNESK